MIKLPLVGPAYKMQSQSISSQNCINWYPQTIEYPNGSRVAALMPTPGLKKIFQGITAAARCLHVLSNGALLAVIGNKLYHSKATKFDLTEIGLVSALGTVRVADNGRVALIVNGTYTYSLDLKKLTLERLSGSAIPRSTHVVFLDGRFVFNKVNTGQFHWSDLYSTNVNALSYATAESTPDNITAIIKANPSELWLFGPQSVERYYGTGSANAPYSRLSGGAMAFGCLSPDSIVALSTGVIWLGVSEFGGNQIVMSGGGIPERISTHALEEEIASFSKTTDAMAYAYQMEGHVFYVITFPSANVTFCYDVSTGLWHQRSFANPQGLHERHRSQHHAFYNNIHIVGDYRNGKLYQLDNNIFTDDGELILRERTAQAVITDNKLTRFNQLQIICETGFFGSTKPAPQPPLISCTGALNITDWIDIDGLWNLEVDGQNAITSPSDIFAVAEYLNANGFDVVFESDNPSYVGLYAKINPNPSVTLSKLTITKNGVGGQFPPDEFLPYVWPNSLQALPPDNIDIGLVHPFQFWGDSTPSYFFNHSDQENTYGIEFDPPNQDQLELVFWSEGESLGHSIKLGTKDDDLSAKGTSYTTAYKDWGSMATVGQEYCLTIEASIFNGPGETQTRSVVAGNETMGNLINKYLAFYSLYRLRDKPFPTTWKDYYSGLKIQGDQLIGNNASYTYSETGGFSLAIPIVDRVRATLTFKPTTNLPPDALDFYDYIRNELGASVVTTQGLLYAGEVNTGE